MSMISPQLGALPLLDVDCAAVSAGAAEMRKRAEMMRSRMGDLRSTWSGLGGVLQMEGVPRLYTAFEAASTVTDEYADDVVAAATAMEDFAETVAGLQAERDLLAGDIMALRSAETISDASVSQSGGHDAGVPAGMSPALIELQSSGLRGQINELIRRFELAEDDCVRVLRRLEDGCGLQLRPLGAGDALGMAASGAPIWASQAARLQASITGQTLRVLGLLGTMSERQQRAWLAAHPEFLEMVAAVPPPAADVAAWWRTLGADQSSASVGQLALIATVPALLGNLEGVGYWARNLANRSVLAGRLKDLVVLKEQLDRFVTSPLDIEEIEQNRSSLLTEHGYDEASFADALSSNRAIEKALGSVSTVPPRMLVSLDGSVPPLAAISVGDLDRADHTTYLVSGMYSSTGGMVGAVDQAVDLYAKETDVSKRFSLGGSVAVVAWIGYDSPNLVTVNVPNPLLNVANDAEVGAGQLADALTGYGAVNDLNPSPSLLTVGAHSYGSTVSMLALRQEVGVDAFAIYGSAGAYEVDSVKDLAVPKGQVFVTEARGDWLAGLGRFGGGRADPSSDSFGAHVFGSDGYGVDPDTGQSFTPTTRHEDYLIDKSETQRNLAYVGLGLGDRVTDASTVPTPRPQPSPTPPGVSG